MTTSHGMVQFVKIAAHKDVMTPIVKWASGLDLLGLLAIVAVVALHRSVLMFVMSLPTALATFHARQLAAFLHWTSIRLNNMICQLQCRL